MDSEAAAALALARRFAEQLVAEALESGPEPGTSPTDPAVDWPALLASTEATASPERAAGRLVISANRVARAVSGTPLVVEGPPRPGPRQSSATPSDVVAAEPVAEAAAPPACAPTSLATLPSPGIGADQPADDLESEADEPSEPVPAEADPPKRRRRLSRVLTWVGNIVLIVSLSAAWQIWGTAVVEHHSQTQLAGQFQRDASVSAGDDRRRSLIAATTEVAVPPAGALTARIQISALGLSQFVVEGTSVGDLEKGPGHVTGTAVPGQAGNVAIAGRRTTFAAPFGRLDDLRPGDPIILTTTTGEALTYLVAGPPAVVSASDTAIFDRFGDNRLTLTTSDPTYSGGHRLVVVALLRPGSASPATAASVSTPPVGGPPGRLAASDTQDWHLAQLPLVIGIVLALLLTGLAYGPLVRRLRRLGATPVFIVLWVAGIYVLSLALTNLLPSTF